MTDEQFEMVRSALKQKRRVVFRMNVRSYINCGENIKAFTKKGLIKRGITKSQAKHLRFVPNSRIEHGMMEVEIKE